MQARISKRRIESSEEDVGAIGSAESRAREVSSGAMTNIEELLDQYDAVHNEVDPLSAGEINDQKFKELNERRNRLEKEMSRQISELAKTDPILAAKIIERSSDQRVRWIEYWSYVTGGDAKEVIAEIEQVTARAVEILNGGGEA